MNPDFCVSIVPLTRVSVANNPIVAQKLGWGRGEEGGGGESCCDGNRYSVALASKT